MYVHVLVEKFRAFIPIFISVFFLFQPIVMPSYTRLLEGGAIEQDGMKLEVFSHLLMLLLFWLNYLYLIPYYYLIKAHKQYIFFVCVGVFIVSVLQYILFINYATNIEEYWHFELFSIIDLPPLILYFMLLYKYAYMYFGMIGLGLLLRIRNNLIRIERNKHEVEISTLLSKINPHFLFNALNSIYVLNIKEGAEKSADAVHRLSQLMRYLIAEVNEHFIPLEKEILYIENYIALQELRLDESVVLIYDCRGKSEGKKIAPLITLPFIENAFKHGVNPDEDSKIDISICIEENIFKMCVRNNKVNVQYNAHEQSGIGIENTKDRLALLYPGKHNLLIEENELYYTVHLSIIYV